MSVDVFVICFSDGWSTMVNGRRGARHTRQRDAVDAAIRLARGMEGRGRRASISVQEPFGELRPLPQPPSPPPPSPLHAIHRVRDGRFSRLRDSQLSAEPPPAKSARRDLEGRSSR